MFERLEEAQPDKILHVMSRFRADTRTGKTDLGVGVYRDDAGGTPIFGVVKEAERRVLEGQETKSYIGIEGDPGFNAAVAELALGDLAHSERVAACQAAGGSGALRILGDLAARANPGATVWLPEPTWPNHAPLMAAARLPVRAYPYYDAGSGAVDFAAMTGAIEAAQAGDFILVHACCHNPTGADLDTNQWATLGELMASRKLVPLVDMAYLGFGDGLEADAAGTRLLAVRVPEIMVAVSCSKNFGLYRDRAGCAIAIAEDASAARLAASQMSHIVRSGHSMPPDHGAVVVRTILEDEGLRKDWVADLDMMRRRMNDLRRAFATALDRRRVFPAVSALADQRGMFSLLPLRPDQVDRLCDEHAIYMTQQGRINIAGLRTTEIDRIADAIAGVCTS